MSRRALAKLDAVTLGTLAVSAVGAYLGIRLMLNPAAGQDAADAVTTRRHKAKGGAVNDPLNYNERHEEERVLTGRGPTSLADLKKQTDAKRKRIADEYYKAQYERALKIQEEDRLREEALQARAEKKKKAGGGGDDSK